MTLRRLAEHAAAQAVAAARLLEEMLGDEGDVLATAAQRRQRDRRGRRQPGRQRGFARHQLSSVIN